MAEPRFVNSSQKKKKSIGNGKCILQKSPADVIESGDKFSAFGVEATGQSSKEVLCLSLWERTMKTPVPV